MSDFSESKRDNTLTTIAGLLAVLVCVVAYAFLRTETAAMISIAGLAVVAVTSILALHRYTNRVLLLLGVAAFWRKLAGG